MSTRKQIAENQKILYDDAVANNMFQAAVPSFEEFQKRLERNDYQKIVYDNYRKHDVKGTGFNSLEEFRGKFGGSFYSDEAKRELNNNAQYISDAAKQSVNNFSKYNKLKQRKQKQKNDFGRVTIGSNKTPFGGNAEDVVKDDFAIDPVTGKAGAYVTSDNDETSSLTDAQQKQAALDSYNETYQKAVDTGEIPSVFDVRDKDGNYDLQENIGKDGTYLTEEGTQAQLDKKLADAYARKEELEEAIAEDDKKNGDPLLSYSASLGGSNGRDAKSSDYRNQLAISLSLVKQQIGSLEAVKQYPTSSMASDAWKALDNTAFTAKTWDFGITDFATMGQMERIKSKMDNKIPLTTSEQTLLKSKLGADAAEALEDEKMGNVYRWTKIAGQSLPFMLDFFLTGGYGGITDAISKSALKFAAKKGMGKISAAVLKNTGVVLGDIAGSYAMAGTTQAAKTGADIMQRHMGNLYQDENGNYAFGTFDENGNLVHEGGESFGTALYKGLTSAMVENYTEKLFGHSYGVKKGALAFMEKHGMAKSAEFFKNIGKKEWYAGAKKWMGKFGINGFGEEVMEEEIGIPLHALLDGDNKFSDLWDAKQQLDIIGGMAISVGSMYAMGAGTRPLKGVYNRAQYYRFKHKVTAADNEAFQLLGEDYWPELRERMDNATNEQMGGVLHSILQGRDTLSKEQIKAAVMYGVNLMKMRGYNLAKAAEMNAREMTGEQENDRDNHDNEIETAYSEGHDAEGESTHTIQLEQNESATRLAGLLGITEEQLHNMSDDELEAKAGENDELDEAIYDYQASTAKYQGVMDNANDKVDMAGREAALMIDQRTDLNRGTVRTASIKATQGAEDYDVFIISGNLATHDDGTVDVSGSDQMILYYDPKTGRKEYADPSRFASVGEEQSAEEMKNRAVMEAKDKVIREQAGIIDGKVEEGSTFTITDADGTEHTYEVLADNGDGTAMITLDGNVEYSPYSFNDLQQLKDAEDQKKMIAARQQRAELESQRQQQKQIEQEQDEENQARISQTISEITDDNGNVVIAAVEGEEDADSFIVGEYNNKKSGKKKYKVVTLNADGTVSSPRLVDTSKVTIMDTMPADEYQQVLNDTQATVIEDNGGLNNNQEDSLGDELPPVPDNVTINGDGTYSVDGEVQGKQESHREENKPVTPSYTLSDGTEVPMREDGNPDTTQMTAAQTAEFYDTQFGEDAEGLINGWVSDAKKALDTANKMTVKGKDFVEQKASKDAKTKAIADAQAKYDSAQAIADAYKERMLAKQESTAEGRRSILDKAKAKYNRLKGKAEQVQALWNETVGAVLHRLYDHTGVDVFDNTPQTIEEYVSSSIAPFSLNYEGNDNSKGVKQETGLERKDFAKSHILAAEGKGTTVDEFVHKLWENRPAQFESATDQDIRNALLDLITSDMNAYDMRHVIENNRIAQAEKAIEDEQNAAESAAHEEETRAAAEEETPAVTETTEAEEGAPAETDDALPFAPSDESDVPFSERDNVIIESQQERAENVERNHVDDNEVVDAIVGKKVRKALERIARMMGAKIQWQYSDRTGNGWYDEATNTIYLTLDSSITEGAQFIFGHEMTHEIKTKNPAAYEELKTLVKDMLGEDMFDAMTDTTEQKYRDAGIIYTGGREAYEEEVVADQIGTWLNDANYAHTLALKMSHPLLAAIHDIIVRIKMAFNGTEYTDNAKLILRTIEQAYVKTANREAVNTATQEGEGGQRLSLRTKPDPKKTQKVYKLMRLGEDGKLYPLFIGSAESVELGKWYDADSPALKDLKSLSSKDYVGKRTVTVDGKDVQEEYKYGSYIVNNETGEAMSLADFKKQHKGDKRFSRIKNNPNAAALNWATDNGYRWIKIEEKKRGQSRYGGENRSYYNYGINGTGAVGIFAMRPGWHAGSLPTMRQIGKGQGKNLRDDTFVWVEGEIPADYDYNEEAQKNADKDIPDHIPTDGYYLKATNANKEASQADKVGWYVAGAFMPKRIMSDKETREVIDQWNKEHPNDEPVEYDWKRESGKDFNAETMSLEDTPKFSLKTYHGTGADFTEFDFKHMNEGAGSQAFGWGGYVTSSWSIGRSYALLVDDDPSKREYATRKSNGEYFLKAYPTLEAFLNNEYIKKASWTEDEKVDYYKKRVKDAEPYHNLYEVNIPDDNGTNYIDWDRALTDEQQKMVYEALYALSKEQLDKMATDDAWFRNMLYSIITNVDKERAIPVLVSDNTLTKSTTLDEYDIPNEGSTVYHRLKNWLDSAEEASKLLASAGFTGIKYEAGRNYGGNEEGDMNYVIFKPEDMQIAEHTKFSIRLKTDNQGNPLNADGTLKLDKIKSVDDLTDEDFTKATRNVQLPTIPKNVDDAIGANGKPVIIKKNIFEKNWNAHKFTPAESRKVLHNTLYNTDLVGRTQPTKKPNHWVAIKLDEKSPITVLEANDNKDNVEVVGWYTLDERNLGRIKRQAERNGGKLIMLSPADKVESLSTPSLNSAAKIDNSSESSKENAEKFSLKDKPVRFEAGKSLSEDEKKEVLATMKDAYKVNGVSYHIEETAGGKEKRVYEATADDYVKSDITNRPLRYYITLPDGRIAHPSEVYPNISDHDVRSSVAKQETFDNEAADAVERATASISNPRQALEILNELQALPHETRDAGYGMSNATSYDYKTGLFISDASQAIDYVVRRMRRKGDVPAELVTAVKNAVANSFGMVDNVIDYLDKKADNGIRYSLKQEKESIIAEAKKNGTYLKAPNGEDTNLDSDQWVTVRTSNFKNWFGDWEKDPEHASKVVDENGEPKVMYHYTDENFTEFKEENVGKNTFGNATDAYYAATTAIGAWFTDNNKQPAYMGEPMQVFLNAREPFDCESLENLAATLSWYITEEDAQSYEEDWENNQAIVDAGKDFQREKIEDGYDSVVIDDEEFGGTSYVSFNPNQIKSADDYNGDFSTDNNDIRYSLKSVNDKFNAELDRYVKGEMKSSEMLHIGNPNGVMRIFLPDLPIVMRQRILTKGSIKKHNVAVESLADMPKHLAHPIFVFKRSDNALGVLTEMKDRDGKNVCVAIELNRQIQDGGDILEVNDIRSIHGRDVTEIIYPIVQNGTLKWADKEKGLAYLSSASQYVQQEIDKQGLETAAKIIKDFESSKENGEKVSLEEKSEGWKQANKKAIHIAEAIERDPKFSLKRLDGTLIKAGTYFSGGGLVEEGLKGVIDPVVAVEYDEKISGVYRNNFGKHIVTADVRDVDPKELVKSIDGEVEFFHASPVCKNFSQAKANHEEVELDKETAQSTADFINQIKPAVVTIENVKGYRDSDAMKIITDALDANGYKWDADVYNAADYGGYTSRERLIVRAVKDGSLPPKPEKQPRKSGWYEAVEDIIPTLTEKKNGVAPWMDIRLQADGIDWRNIDKPLYVMGSAYADGKIPHAFADDLLPTLRTKSGDVIVMPGGKVYRAMGRVLARVSGMSDDYQLPHSESLAHTIIGNGIPTQLTENIIAPLLMRENPKFSLKKSADSNNGEFSAENNDIRYSLRADRFRHDLNEWKKANNLPKDAQRPSVPVREPNETAADFMNRVKEYRKEMAMWKTAPTYEGHLLTDDTAQGEFNRELQRGTVQARIALQDSMLAIRKAQEAIMKEVGVDRLSMAEDAYTAENRSHGKGKNEFEEYNDEFLQPLRKAYNALMKKLGKSYDNVKVYMIAKHGLERNAHMAFAKALEKDYDKQSDRIDAYNAYKGDVDRLLNDTDYQNGQIDFTTWRQRDNAIRLKYAPSYLDYRYDKMGITQDYSGLSALFDGSDFEEAATDLVEDVESNHPDEADDLWYATNDATKKVLRDSYKAGMMTKDVYEYVRDMYRNYIPLRGWGDTNADQVWNYIGGGKGAFCQTLKEAHGRESLADDPIAYIENMAESGILLNNKNWVKQHLLLLAENHPTSLLNVSKAWYVKTTDAQGNEHWIPASPQIAANMTAQQVELALEAFEQKMEQMKQSGDATQKREHLEISYPQTNGEEREHEVRVMRNGEEYVIYINGDPQLAQAMNNTRAQRVREGLQNSISQKVIAWVGRKMAAAYTSLSPLFIPSNYARDLTMTLASSAIREDARYNYLLRKNMLTHWNTLTLVLSYQNGTLREKVRNGSATKTEQMFYDYMMNGGETGFVSSLDVEDLKKKFKNELKDMNRMVLNPKKVGHVIMDGIETLNRAIEGSNRFMVYMTSIQYGRSIEEAVNNAKDVTLNFNRKGTGEHGWQTIRNLYLFINPAIQSLQTLGALAKHHPFKFTAVTTAWLASGVLVPVINGLMMSMLGGDDDKDKYWSFTKWDRRNNMILWIPFTHEFFKIPLAQEFRGFYGVGDMIASKLMGGEKAEQSWDEYAEDFLGQVVDMLPLDPTGYDGNIAVSLMPSPIRPFFELAFNVDFTGKPLFKDSEYNKYDPNFTKAFAGTPDWLVRISKMVNSIGNDYPDVQQNAIDKFGDPRYNLNNPAVVDHILSSYLGGAYTMGSQVLGVATKLLNGDEVKMADVPILSKFVSNPDDRPVSKKQGDEFWTTKERHYRAANTLSKLKKKAKVDGNYTTLEIFFASDEYKQYKEDDKVVKKYEADKKKEKAEESGEEYKPHKTNYNDVYKAHATPRDDFEDLKLSQLYQKVKGFSDHWNELLDEASSLSQDYYEQNADAIQAAEDVKLIIEQMNGIKKDFLVDGKDAYSAEDMKELRDLRNQALSILEKVKKGK